MLELVTPDLVRGMFANGDGSGTGAVEQPAVAASDLRFRLLLALVAACGAGFRSLRPLADEAAWGDLADAVVRLYESERTVSGTPGDGADPGDLVRAAEAKSVLPFVIVDRIVALAGERPPGRDERASNVLGMAVGLADDLVDIASDLDSGAANGLVVEMAGRVAEGDLESATDGDLYDVVDAASARLRALLEPRAAGPEGESVMKFARATVARWIGWEEESGAPRGPPPRARAVPPHRAEAVRFLLEAQADGYDEAAHRLTVPRIGPDGVRIEAHAGTLFQRAIVVDALLDARDHGHSVPRNVLDAEAWAILRAKRRDVAGGWSYLPEVTELPPDADDLAAVLRVLVRVGGPDLAAACRRPVDLALAAADADGGIPTWILDDGPDADVHRAYVALTESGGTHPDVVANLVSALVLLDDPRHREPVAAAAAYLEGAQDERGAWASRWYAGPYYGTCRAVSALARAAPESTALDRAAGFLLGVDRHDDPLATALAGIALAELGRCRQLDGVAGALDDAAARLETSREADGGWPACPFISFPRSDGAELHVYASRTVTTAFCLQALLASHREAEFFGPKRGQSPRIGRSSIT